MGRPLTPLGRAQGETDETLMVDPRGPESGEAFNVPDCAPAGLARRARMAALPAIVPAVLPCRRCISPSQLPIWTTTTST